MTFSTLARYFGALSDRARYAPLSIASDAWPVLAAGVYLRQCTRVGFGARAFGRPHIANNGTLIIGERLRIFSTMARTELVVFKGGKLEIGDCCAINYGTSIAATGSVRIGNRCRIGTYVLLLDNDFHTLERRDVRPPSRPVVIEDDVWICNRVIVLPGVTVGHGAVLGAGAVVTGDVPPRSLAIGNPARVHKTF